jgi:hypothetical protein
VNSVAARLDYDKASGQLTVAIQRQYTRELGVHGILSRWRDAQIDHARPVSGDEHERAEITIARDEDSPQIVGDAQQRRVTGLGETKLGHRDNVMSQAS